MGGPLAFLAIEDSQADFVLLERHCRRENMDIHWQWVDRLEQLRAALAAREWDLVLSDYHLPGLKFTDAFAVIRSLQPELPVILLSGHVGEETAIEMLKLGVRDVIFKDNLRRLVPVIHTILREVEEARAFHAADAKLKQVMRDLRKSEKRYRVLASNAPAIIWRFDPQGTILDISGAHERLLGYAASELVGGRLRPLVHPEDVEPLRAFTHRVKADAGELTVSTRLRTKSGPYVWIETISQAVRDESGQVVEQVSISRDITIRKQTEERLQASEARYRMLASNVSDIIWRTNPQGIVTDVVGAFEAILHLGRDELIGHSTAGFAHPEDHRRWSNFERRMAAKDGSTRVELRFRRSDGGYVWIETNGRAVRNEQGEITEFVATSRDVTRRKEGEQNLDLYRTMFRSTQEGIVITDVRGTVIIANPSFSKITGWEESKIIGKNPKVLKSGRHDAAFYRQMFEVIAAEGHWQGEIWNRKRNGEIYPEWLTISSMRDEKGKISNYIGTFIDISQVKESEARLEHLAHHDPLTDLPNRLLLSSRLQHAIGHARREASKGAILFLDLDRFKNVNDSLGHLAGDELLQQVAQRYLLRLRDTDTLCRHGGDEFIVLVENLREAGHAAGIAQSLIDELGTPFLLAQKHEVHIGVSIGISVFPDDGENPVTIVSNADAAMYQAKKSGRNTFAFYTETLTKAARQRVELEASLRRGVERNEFLLHYQPLVSMTDLRVTGVEALIRWQLPGGDLVPPMHFIPLAEETGMIMPIGEYVLRAACAQMKAWLDAGLALDTMAVNLSAHQFRQPDLRDRLQAILRETQLPADCLELEITESVLMESGGEVERVLWGLKSLGLRLAIDDFGTGYSSLAYLKRFPIDKLTVDRSFVRDIPNDPAGMQIVAAVIGLGKNLNLQVLAEGIETEAQFDFLRRQGCNSAQGFLFSQPVAAIDLPPLMRERAFAPRLSAGGPI